MLRIIPGGYEYFALWRPRIIGSESTYTGLPYVAFEQVKVGTILTELLALDLQDSDSFRRFVERFGLEPFLFCLRFCSPEDVGKKLEESGELEITPEELDAYRNSLLDCAHQGRHLGGIGDLRTIVQDWLDEHEEWAKGLTPVQRYYYKVVEMHDEDRLGERFSEMLRTVHSKVVPDLVKRDHSGKIIDWLEVAQGYNLTSFNEMLNFYKYEVVLTDEYDESISDNIIAICVAEIKEMLRQGCLLRRCRHCGNYFIPERSDEFYCSRVLWFNHRKTGPREYPLVGITCQMVGPRRAYEERLKGHPIKSAYRRAYKRRHARVSNGELSKSEFQHWLSKLRIKMAEAEAGLMTAAEFDTWTRQQDVKGEDNSNG